MARGLVRIPDVAFIAWERLLDRRIPTDPMPGLAPNLAIEIPSAGNTAAEMARKRRDYFDAGVQVVWLVDPRTRMVEVYTALDQCTRLHEDDTLHGGMVLPEFTLSPRELFGELDRQDTE